MNIPVAGLEGTAAMGMAIAPARFSLAGTHPMPIRAYLQDSAAFEPEAIDAMSKAFEEACIALQIYAGDQHGREAVATRIIDLARNGVIDPTALRERVLLETKAVHGALTAAPPKRKSVRYDATGQGRTWSPEEDAALRSGLRRGDFITDVAERLGRTLPECHARLAALSEQTSPKRSRPPP